MSLHPVHEHEVARDVATAIPSILRSPIAWPSNIVAMDDGEGRPFFLQPTETDQNNPLLGTYPLRVPAGEERTTVLSAEETYWYRLTWGIGRAKPDGLAFSNVWPIFVSIRAAEAWTWVDRWTPMQAVFGRTSDEQYPIPGGGILMAPGDDLVIDCLNDGDVDTDVYLEFFGQRLLETDAEEAY